MKYPLGSVIGLCLTIHCPCTTSTASTVLLLLTYRRAFLLLPSPCHHSDAAFSRSMPRCSKSLTPSTPLPVNKYQFTVQQAIAQNKTVCPGFIGNSLRCVEKHPLPEHHYLVAVRHRYSVIKPLKRKYQSESKIQLSDSIHNFLLSGERGGLLMMHCTPSGGSVAKKSVSVVTTSNPLRLKTSGHTEPESLNGHHTLRGSFNRWFAITSASWSSV